ncbi:MAG TPA: endonuclease/exonuclease/phosphatase family protein [Pyrinomonadaceae bacterium]|nr:endonuclease/exonuclease/phosphatase family protein [Pyrinomonadaceae bacterium]
MKLKLLSYNIRFGGRERQAQLAEVINEIEPDIVVFQEASDPGVIEYLGDACRMPFRAARAKNSVGFISRLAVVHHEWHHPRGAHHSFLEIQLSETEMRIFGLHLKARFSKWSERQRHAEIRALLESIKRHQDGFHLIVGDFNTLAPNEVFNLPLMPLWIRALIWISGRDIRRDTIQTMLDAGYLDGFRHLYPDDKGYTFPVWQPHVRLDYIFVPARYSAHLKSCEVVKAPPVAARASDHFPLLCNLEIG